MTTTAQIFLLLVTLTILAFVVRMVRRKTLQSKYSLLWLAIACGMVVLSIFPDTADHITEELGVDYPPAAFLAVAVAFLFVVIVQYSWELSRLEARTRVLAEEVALLKESVRRMADADHPEDQRGPT